MLPTLSPIERAVLASLDQWRCLGELEADLEPEFSSDRIRSTIAWLRRQRMILPLDDPELADRLGRALYWRRTQHGQLALIGAHTGERILHAV